MKLFRPDLVAVAFLLLLSVTGAHSQGTIQQSGPAVPGQPPAAWCSVLTLGVGFLLWRVKLK